MNKMTIIFSTVEQAYIVKENNKNIYVARSLVELINYLEFFVGKKKTRELLPQIN